MDRLKMAAELRERADKLEREDARNLPEKWEVGQRVRFIRSEEWAFSEGQEATIVSLRDEHKGRKACEYQVFHTQPDDKKALWWTTPDDVELV